MSEVRQVRRLGAAEIDELKLNVFKGFISAMSYLRCVCINGTRTLPVELVRKIEGCQQEFVRLFERCMSAPVMVDAYWYAFYVKADCPHECAEVICNGCDCEDRDKSGWLMYHDKVQPYDVNGKLIRVAPIPISLSNMYNGIEWLSDSGEEILRELIKFRRKLPKLYDLLAQVEICEPERFKFEKFETAHGETLNVELSMVAEFVEALEANNKLCEDYRKLKDTYKIMLSNLNGSYSVIEKLIFSLALSDPEQAKKCANGVKVKTRESLIKMCANSKCSIKSVVDCLYQTWAVCALRSLA